MTVDELNKQISTISESMASYVKNAGLMGKMMKQMGKPKSLANVPVKRIEKIEKPVVKKNVQQNKPREKKVEKKSEEQQVRKPSEIGMDYRYNPVFLKVAEYFGIDQKEYPNAVNKIAAIADWAVGETNSNNPSAVISKIAEASRSLQSPGMGERRYSILYRYIKLAEEGHTVDRAIEGQKKDVQPGGASSVSSNLQAQKQDIEKEMAAYQTA